MAEKRLRETTGVSHLIPSAIWVAMCGMFLCGGVRRRSKRPRPRHEPRVLICASALRKDSRRHSTKSYFYAHHCSNRIAHQKKRSGEVNNVTVSRRSRQSISWTPVTNIGYARRRTSFAFHAESHQCCRHTFTSQTILVRKQQTDTTSFSRKAICETEEQT